MNRIAVYGGAFDPPHNAHMEIAKAAISEFGYEEIVFLPSYNPPHKRLRSDAEDRIKMLELAIGGREEYSVNTFEARGNIGYTAETLPKLRSIIGDFDFIIGGDSMIDMHKWYCPERILQKNNIVVAARGGEYTAVEAAIRDFGKDARSVKIMSFSPSDISSTDIRLLARLNEDIGALVPAGVARYIEAERLYRDPTDAPEILRNSLDTERYRHTVGVVKAAMKLNEQLGLNCDKVFYAALLHDAAKSPDYVNNGYPIPSDSIGTPVEHAFAGAFAAREKYGIDDTEILNAIYYHTTARPNMTALDKLIYVADMIEAGRDFDGLEALRETAYRDVNAGFIVCLKHTYNHLKDKGADIYPLTVRAYEYYGKESAD